MFRLYVDEVGTDDLVHLDKDNHRYLSLTGVAMRLDEARDVLEPSMDRIKARIFKQDPDNPVILHRKEILGNKGVFETLRRNPEKRKEFNQDILSIFSSVKYTTITALIDKSWMVKQKHWHQRHPYHYLMEIIVEKYAQFLERENDIGDIMPESRMGKKDCLLQGSFTTVKQDGTHYVDSNRINSVIRSKNLKFRTKKSNISGLQICDLIAHPSHINTRVKMGHSVCLGPFSQSVVNILEANKYDRSPYNGKIEGYGIKHLP